MRIQEGVTIDDGHGARRRDQNALDDGLLRKFLTMIDYDKFSSISATATVQFLGTCQKALIVAMERRQSNLQVFQEAAAAEHFHNLSIRRHAQRTSRVFLHPLQDALEVEVVPAVGLCVHTAGEANGTRRARVNWRLVNFLFFPV